MCRLSHKHYGLLNFSHFEAAVNSRHLHRIRHYFGTLFFVGLLTLVACVPSISGAEEASRDQQIAEIEKQIADLSKKLQELKAKPVTAPVTQPVSTQALPADFPKALTWRSIGPATMAGRITAISVFEADPTTYWVATASGGLVKTTNSGTTFQHQFDHESTVSIGDVQVAPSDKNIVWVGTGENNPRNSVSYGDGVYKSTDGGKTWTNMGLKKTFQIGKIAIHPKDPNIVYVGALGRLYGPNEDRGLYKTTDGGKTWTKIYYIDDKTGIIDLRLSPADPETVYIAAWERTRDGFDSHPGNVPMEDGYDGYDPSKKWGAKGGLFKSTDGGKTFKKLTAGLPSNATGRIGIDIYLKDPKTLFAIIDCEKIGMGTPPAGQAAEGGYMGISGQDVTLPDKKKIVQILDVTPGGPAAKAGLLATDTVVTLNGKPLTEGYKSLVDAIRAGKVGDKFVFEIQRGMDKKSIEVALAQRSSRPYGFMYGGQSPNVQDRQGPNSHEYGGVYKSTDGGETWTRINSLNPRPMYFSLVRVDPSDDKFVYVGGVTMYLSSDGGKTFRTTQGQVHDDRHALWIDPKDGRHMIVGCDGGFYVTYDRMENWDHLNHLALGQFYHVAIDTKKPYNVYGGLQDNGTWGGPTISFNSPGPLNEDWVMVGGGDGFVCRVDPLDPDVVYWESQDGNMMRRNMKTGEGRSLRPRERGQQSALYRYNWLTPFILSSHNPRIYYSAANVVFRSLKQGEEQKPISPDITRTPRGSGSALAESPVNADVLWVGSDDGYIWVTQDGGKNWTNVTQQVGLPGPRWVASIEPSRFKEGRAYVTFDGHRSDDDEPYAYVTEDFGKTWKSIRGNLPTGSTRVLREDIKAANVLYLGTEFAVWASIDSGATWTKINNNLPTVAVHELAQHPDGDMVAATHGRSLWVVDVTPLRQMKADTPKAAATLYAPATSVRWRIEPQRGSIYGNGVRHFVGTNPPSGPQIYYSLGTAAKAISLKVVDYAGKTVRDFPSAAKDVGLHHVGWRNAGGGGGRGQGGGGGGGGGQGASSARRHVSRRPQCGRQGICTAAQGRKRSDCQGSDHYSRS